MSWQPIETAPSGVWVLLWTPPQPPGVWTAEELASGWGRDGRYINDSGSGYENAVMWTGYQNQRGYWDSYYSGTNPSEPTHWMPLPPPPDQP